MRMHAYTLPHEAVLIEQASSGARLYHLRISSLRVAQPLHATAGFSALTQCGSHKKLQQHCHISGSGWAVVGSAILEATINVGMGSRT